MSTFRWFGRLLSDMKLRNKLHISFVLFLILPLAVFTFLFDNRASGTLREQTVISAQQTFSEAEIKLENKFNLMSNVIDQVTLNATLNEILAKSGYESYGGQMGDYIALVSFLENLERSQQGLRLQVYMQPSFAATTDDRHTFLLSALQSRSWYRELEHSGSSLYWFASEDGGQLYLSAARIIWNLKDLTHRIGVIKADIPADLARGLMAQSLIDRAGQTFLVDGSGQIAVKAGDGPLDDADLVARIGTGTAEPNGEPAPVLNDDSRHSIVYSQAIAGTDWRLGSVIPLKSVLRPIEKLRNQMLLVLLSIAVIGYLIALYAANLSTKRVGRLIRRMRNLHMNELKPMEEPFGKDEIGELFANFNEMILRIQQLVQERFHSGQALKSTELRLLQAQINPHFLYNSLDVINIMAVERQAPDISRMARALSAFYKLGLNKGKDAVPVADELEHVRVYVTIQNIRFDNRIRLEVRMPEDCLGRSIPKFVLQPLAENAILHGILEKKSGEGTIIIAGETTSQYFRITVSDDGVGMSEGVCRSLLDAPASPERAGFGLRNVNERIRLAYGEAFGLAVRSVPNEGTAVVVSFPLEENAGEPDDASR